MNYKQKIKVFRTLDHHFREGEEWLCSVPREISTFLFENPYAEACQNINNLLLETLFTPQELMDVEWFLYEWQKGKVRYDKVINNIEEYIDLLVSLCGWED